MSEEAFSVTLVGLFGCSLGFSSMFCTAIVVAGGSWTSNSGVRVTFHLISTFLLQELDQVALDFTLTRAWPSTALSSATIGGAWPPSAALGRHRRSLAIDGLELGRHRRSLAAIGGARPPSAELGHRRRSLAAFGGVRLPPAALGRPRRRSVSIGGAWTPPAALGRTSVCGAWPPSAALGSARPPAAARTAWLRLLPVGPCAGLSVLWDNRRNGLVGAFPTRKHTAVGFTP
jgi:hypothetical protein